MVNCFACKKFKKEMGSTFVRNGERETVLQRPKTQKNGEGRG